MTTNETNTMIPAKIIEISDKVKVEYTNILKPDKNKCFSMAEWRRMYRHYESSRTIAEVDNDRMTLHGMNNEPYEAILVGVTYRNIELNQSCFIEPTTEGKCKIIKLN